MAALLPLFAETLARASPTMAASTVVIAVTKPAFDTCRQHKLLCFHDKEAEERNQELARAGNPRNLPRNKEPLFLQIGWDKLKRLRVSTHLTLHSGSTLPRQVVWPLTSCRFLEEECPLPFWLQSDAHEHFLLTWIRMQLLSLQAFVSFPGTFSVYCVWHSV